MKRNILALALSVVGAIAPLSASAQDVPPRYMGNLGGGANLCTLTIFVGPDATQCSGFYEGNGNSGDAGNPFSATHQAALADFGLPTSGLIIEKRNFTKANELDPDPLGLFLTSLSGPTVIGFHWGNYGGQNDPAGNVSAYYVFAAGQSYAGLDPIFRQSLSNGVVLRTGTVVPEPSTYALMAAGLAGLGLVARRRRNA